MNTFILFSKILSKGANFLERLSPMDERFNAKLTPTTKILPTAVIDNLSGKKELISVGADSVILGQLLIFAHDGAISIGKDCYIGAGSRIWSSISIEIGDRVLISHGVNIHDTNSHSLDPVLRHQQFKAIITTGHPIDDIYDIESKPISIASDVWIGFNASILKGVTIGQGAIVAACALVTHDVPPWTVVAGNPAKVIRELVPFKKD